MVDTPRAFLRDLLTQRYEDLKRKLTWRLGSSELASDALHDTWVHLDDRADRQSEVKSPGAYLMRIAMNMAFDRVQRERRYMSDDEIDALMTEFVDPAPGPAHLRSPSSSTAHQPLDHGITHALKTQWRRLWLQYILAQYNSRSSPSSFFDHYHLHKALTWLHVAWAEHLSNASVRTGFAHAVGEHDRPGPALGPDPVIAETIATLASVGLLQSPMAADDFIAPADETVRFEPTLLSRPDWEIAIVAEEINREQAEQCRYNNSIANGNGTGNADCDDGVTTVTRRQDVNDDSESVLATPVEVEIRKTLSALAFVDQFLYAYPTLDSRQRYQDSVKSMVTSLEGKLAELRSAQDS